MRTKVVVNWLLIAVLLIGCKSFKTIQKSTVKIDSSTVSEVLVSEHIRESKDIALLQEDHSIVKDSSVELITTTEFSVPDSSGKQYPIKVTITEKTYGKVKNADITKSYYGTVKITSDSKNKSKLIIRIKKSIKDKVTTIDKTKAWKTIAAIILSLGIILLVYLLLKRFRIL